MGSEGIGITESFVSYEDRRLKDEATALARMALTDAECQAAAATRMRCYRAGQPVPPDVLPAYREYERRRKSRAHLPQA